MKKYVGSVSAIALALMISGSASSQDTGTVSKAVGGYSFEDAAKEAPGTKDFHSADGQLTFAIVTQRRATASSIRSMSAQRSPAT